MASVIISKKESRDETKLWYYFEWGKGAGQRKASKIFTWTKPKDKLEKRFNVEQLIILEHKRAQLILDMNGTANDYISPDKFKTDFLEFYEEFVTSNKRKGNRHLQSSLTQLKNFLLSEFEKTSLSHTQITEEFCKKFRRYLLDNFNGVTPSNYFSEFKKVIKAATKAGYFKNNPCDNVAARKKPSKPKDIPTEEEALSLLYAPCSNQDVKMAFIFCMYTAQAWADVKSMTWDRIRDNSVLFQREKSEEYVPVPLHPKALAILEAIPKGNPTDKVFKLPGANGANKAVKGWVKNAGMTKHLTWHSARHYVSVMLQLKGVDPQTVAGIMGHASTEHVMKTYKRYVTSAAIVAINKLI